MIIKAIDSKGKIYYFSIIGDFLRHLSKATSKWTKEFGIKLPKILFHKHIKGKPLPGEEVSRILAEIDTGIVVKLNDWSYSKS